MMKISKLIWCFLAITYGRLRQRSNPGWQEEDLGLFDQLMQVHSTIVIEHYSSYLEGSDINKSITRKNYSSDRT
jgi:hypothetical protein